MTIASAIVSSQFPPLGAAMSTTIDPGFMARTISAESRMGDFFPGTIAVVMTTSASAA